LFEAIRRDDRVEQLWFRALPDKYGVHRRTVRQALANAVPPERKTPVRVAPKLDPAKGLIDKMLMLDLTAALAMPEEGNRAYLTTNRSAHLRLVSRRCVCLVTEPSDHTVVASSYRAPSGGLVHGVGCPLVVLAGHRR